jgi:hypothetical protein
MTARIVSQRSRLPILNWGLDVNGGEPVGTFGWFDADYRRTDRFLLDSWGHPSGQLWDRLAEVGTVESETP